MVLDVIGKEKPGTFWMRNDASLRQARTIDLHEEARAAEESVDEWVRRGAFTVAAAAMATTLRNEAEIDRRLRSLGIEP